jgi:hypothetical protein
MAKLNDSVMCYIILSKWTGKDLPTAYNGVLVSRNPRNAPWAASATMIGGAPSALSVRNCSAGARIGESCVDSKAKNLCSAKSVLKENCKSIGN